MCRAIRRQDAFPGVEGRLLAGAGKRPRPPQSPPGPWDLRVKGAASPGERSGSASGCGFGQVSAFKSFTTIQFRFHMGVYYLIRIKMFVKKGPFKSWENQQHIQPVLDAPKDVSIENGLEVNAPNVNTGCARRRL